MAARRYGVNGGRRIVQIKPPTGQRQGGAVPGAAKGVEKVGVNVDAPVAQPLSRARVGCADPVIQMLIIELQVGIPARLPAHVQAADCRLAVGVQRIEFPGQPVMHARPCCADAAAEASCRQVVADPRIVEKRVAGLRTKHQLIPETARVVPVQRAPEPIGACITIAVVVGINLAGQPPARRHIDQKLRSAEGLARAQRGSDFAPRYVGKAQQTAFYRLRSDDLASLDALDRCQRTGTDAGTVVDRDRLDAAFEYCNANDTVADFLSWQIGACHRIAGVAVVPDDPVCQTQQVAKTKRLAFCVVQLGDQLGFAEYSVATDAEAVHKECLAVVGLAGVVSADSQYRLDDINDAPMS